MYICMYMYICVCVRMFLVFWYAVHSLSFCCLQPKCLHATELSLWTCRVHLWTLYIVYSLLLRLAADSELTLAWLTDSAQVCNALRHNSLCTNGIVDNTWSICQKPNDFTWFLGICRQLMEIMDPHSLLIISSKRKWYVLEGHFKFINCSGRQLSGTF